MPLLAPVILTRSLQSAAVYLPPLQMVFDTVALPVPEWAMCFALGFVVLTAIDVVQLLRSRGRQSTPVH